ncbi:hypothetical protein D6D29_04092 [Aureobasidium pullulans]|uniref:Uncharacterized protein n=1 Tax=Aureobasidium pullulans TaxID=5580 RepID=A0A4S9JB33_AURPU|nr:hypothetical protein D6D29_04092 [Aureobasidium pullulans]THW03134.1 hypothetical protein D6D26_03734 [Aureobasidium pullulans]THW10598.1 hypothetical protein D6D24_07814 [Aureobasidium pullulans]THX99690.1 hypothetical protein D6D03_07019 [Aureobasidium pullulans]
MRYHFLLALFAFLALCAANDEHPLCLHVENEQHTLEQKEFSKDSNFGQWLDRQYSDWISINETETNTKGFYNFFVHRFAPHLSHGIVDCDGLQICSPVICDAISEAFDLEEQHFAWLALEAIANFNNARLKIDAQAKSAYEEVTAGMHGLMSDFSDADNVVQTLKAVNARYKSRMQMAGGVGLILRSYLSFVGTLAGFFSPEAGLAINTAGNLLALGLSGFGVGTAMEFDKLTDASDLPRRLDAAVSKVQAANYQVAREMYSLDSELVMSGRKGLLDMTIVDIVQTGLYSEPMKISQEVRDEIHGLQYAQAISNIWDQEHVYIIMAPVKGGSCEDDNRALGKVCLDDWPDHVFYPQFTSRVGDGRKARAMTRLFPGHAKIPQSVNLSMIDVVQSSVAIFEDHGNEPVHLSGDTALEGFLDPATSSFHKGGKFAGIFAIPICYQEDGWSISSINTKESRNYPCYCEASPFGGSSPDEHQFTAANGLVPRQHHNHGSYNLPYDQDETFAFLNATGIHESKGWWEYCHHSHGMNCEIDETVNWAGKFGTKSYNKFNHPFRVCRGRPHNQKGCHSPNDGIHQCGSKASARAGVDMRTSDMDRYDDLSDGVDELNEYDASDDELDEYFG